MRGALMRELILDTETTGINPSEHRLVELACLELVNRIPTGKTWHWYFNPERDIDPGAQKIHGLTRHFLRDKALFRNLASEIRETISDTNLVIHNASFDVGFLNAEFERCRLPVIDAVRLTCTLALARRKLPGGRHSLDALCSRYGISTARRTKHGALVDCELLAEVYAKLTGEEQASLELAEQVVACETAPLVRLRPLVPRITREEEMAHAAMVAGLGSKALWLLGVAA